MIPKILIGIQARSTSQRLPKKIYEMIGDKSLLEHVWDACEKAKGYAFQKGMEVQQAVVGPERDKLLKAYCKQRGWTFYGGDEFDLYDRYLDALDAAGCNALVRVTSDCWNIRPEMILAVILALEDGDYVSNCIERTFAEGQDCQGARIGALRWASAWEIFYEDRQHPFLILDSNRISRRSFVSQGHKIISVVDQTSVLNEHHSIDTQEDLEQARRDYEEDRREMEGAGGEGLGAGHRDQFKTTRILH